MMYFLGGKMKKLLIGMILILFTFSFSACKNIPTKNNSAVITPTEDKKGFEQITEDILTPTNSETETNKTGVTKDSITDKDAFSTYFGKTLDQIKETAPHFEKMNEAYMVESSEDDHGAMILLAFMDEKDICNEVRFAIDKGKLASFGIIDPVSFLNFGTDRMGLSGREIVSEVITDDYQYRLYSDNILCFVIEGDSGSYFLSCSNADTNLLSVYDTLYKSVNDRKITLVESSYSGSTLIATFLFENTGIKNLQVGYSDFEARNGEYEKLELETYNCPGGISLAEMIIPDDKLKGNVCFKNAEKTPVTIYYKTSIFTDVADVYTFTVE